MKKLENKILKIETYTVPTLENKTRIQDLAVGMFSKTPTKSGLKKAIKNNLVTINDSVATTGTFLYGGEKINLFQKQINTIKPTIKIDVEIIYEDDHLALVNKPSGITVSGNKKWTLENALSTNLKKSTEFDALIKPEPIHRLDHPTSGILLIGKTSTAVIALNKIFKERTIQKIYYAVSIGKMKKKGNLKMDIDGRPSHTNFYVSTSVISEKFDFLNLVKVTPITGRKHQIRKHLSEMGNQILGDLSYGKEEKKNRGNGLYLHAYSLNFSHPITQEKIYFTAKLPNKFKRLFPVFNFL